jgi:regulator of RNase E activity RraA
VRPGDVVRGDASGVVVVVVAREHVDEVVTLARAVDDVIRVKRRGTGGELP